MKKIAIAALALVTLTSCAANGTVVKTKRDGDVCYVIIEKNKQGRDEDNTYPIPCLIMEDEVVVDGP